MPDTTVNITLSTAATPSAVQYNSTLIVNGNFSPGSSAVEIVSLSYDSSAITVVQTSSTETQIVYSISALMISNVGLTFNLSLLRGIHQLYVVKLIVVGLIGISQQKILLHLERELEIQQMVNNLLVVIITVV